MNRKRFTHRRMMINSTAFMRIGSLALVFLAALSGTAADPEPIQAGIPPSLQNPLELADGRIIQTAEEWAEILRPQTIEHFREVIYGRTPVGRPENLRFEVKDVDPEAMDGRATRKVVEIHFSGPGGDGLIELVQFIPNTEPKPVPGFLLISHRAEASTDRDRAVRTEYWPAERIVERGYVAATFQTRTVTPTTPADFAEFKSGAFGIFSPEAEIRPADTWGVLAIWAWAASRIMDYFESDPDVDARRIAVTGHSRSGKAALWCGTEDERFALAISNGSGSMGASLSRRIMGETVGDSVRKFPFWFSPRLAEFAEQEETLPVDQHQLIALMAPRLVYVASAEEDIWADPRGEFLSSWFAGPVYNLFGLRGLDVAGMPGVNEPIHSGAIGYHVTPGGHGLTAQDWDFFMDFTDRHWSPQPGERK